MAVRGTRRESGTLNKRVEIVSSFNDTQMGVPNAYNTYAVPGNVPGTTTAFTPQIIDLIIDYMRDADSQIDAQRFANSLDKSGKWERLPGGSADFNQESTSLTDTIFGDGYDSMFPGLITGGITANAIIKGIPGYQVVIRQTGKSMTCSGMNMERVRFTSTTATYRFPLIGSGRTRSPACMFDINNPPKISQFGDGSLAFAQTDGRSDIDYLFGEVTFTTNPGASIQYTGTVVPLVTVGRAQNYNLTQTLNPVDETDFDTAQKNDGRRKFVARLKNTNLELSGFWRSKNNFLQQLNEREPVLLSIDPTGQGDAICRMYAFLMRQGQRGDVGALEEESVTFELNVLDDDRVPNPVGWKFGYYEESNKRGGSIVSLANQMLLDAWLCGTHLGIRYLPNGNDKSDGKVQTGYTTAAIVTDASLSSSLDGVAEFQASFQLDGHVAVRSQVTSIEIKWDDPDPDTPIQLDVSDGNTRTIRMTLFDENGNQVAARGALVINIAQAGVGAVTLSNASINVAEGESTGTITATGTTAGDVTLTFTAPQPTGANRWYDARAESTLMTTVNA